MEQDRKYVQRTIQCKQLRAKRQVQNYQSVPKHLVNGEILDLVLVLVRLLHVVQEFRNSEEHAVMELVMKFAQTKTLHNGLAVLWLVLTYRTALKDLVSGSM